MDEIKKMFFINSLSIDETKASVLIITYIIAFLTIVVMCVIYKDIGTLKEILFATIFAITGINVSNGIFQKNNVPMDNKLMCNKKD
jgi:hypothetical protein